MAELIFLKLGGSLLTDKTAVESLRAEVLQRLSNEIADARVQNPELNLLLGHGSGSFGHVAAAKFGTRQGIEDAAGWQGFAEVADSAARLNREVVGALIQAGVPALTLQPSSSAQCEDGRIRHLDLERPILQALDHGLLPVIYGDVAFDSVRGGTIISTEEIMVHLAPALRPSWFVLAGETDGVMDTGGEIIPQITPDMWSAVLPALGGSRGTDVTGGMEGKVRQMLDLVAGQDHLSVQIFSGLNPGLVTRMLLSPNISEGTIIRR